MKNRLDISCAFVSLIDIPTPQLSILYINNDNLLLKKKNTLPILEIFAYVLLKTDNNSDDSILDFK